MVTNIHTREYPVNALDCAARALGEPLPQRRHSLVVRLLRRVGRRIR